MKNKQRETQFKSAFGVAGHLFGKIACLGAVILICSSAAAQNLFMSDGYSCHAAAAAKIIGNLASRFL